jgi:hypothetical protein
LTLTLRASAICRGDQPAARASKETSRSEAFAARRDFALLRASRRFEGEGSRAMLLSAVAQ